MGFVLADISDRALEAGMLGGFGTIMIVLVIAALREAVAMRRWPIVGCRVLESRVEE